LIQKGVASLGMYDFPHVSAANDQFWELIRDHLGYGPDHLSRDMKVWDIWQSAELVFSQTCGLPFRAKLHDKVQLVGTPDYGIEGCPAGHYNSVIVVHKNSAFEDVNALATKRLAYNEGLSQSGWAAPYAHMKTVGISFEIGPCTGSHKASAQTVANGQADFAALDALTWKMLQLDDPETTQHLRVIATTKPTPALPFITSLNQDAKAIASAVGKAIDALPKQKRDALHLKRLIRLPPSAYLAIAIPPSPELIL
jgi:ABC-type phosphate/phosphonate transport system substrate-binding protein